MTPADIRALAAKATPGPWHVGTTRTYGIYPEGPTESAEAVAFVPHMEPRLRPWRPQGEADAAYVAALDPQTVLGLLDRLERAEAAIAALDEAAAAREALPSVEEMERALRAIGDGPDGCDFAGGEGPDHHSDEFAATLLWHLRAQRGGEG